MNWTDQWKRQAKYQRLMRLQAKEVALSMSRINAERKTQMIATDVKNMALQAENARLKAIAIQVQTWLDEYESEEYGMQPNDFDEQGMCTAYRQVLALFKGDTP